jgi:hypothetical protein
VTSSPVPQTTNAPEPTTSTHQLSPTTHKQAPATTPKPAPTTSKKENSPTTTKESLPLPSLDLPNFLVGTQTGQGTFYSSVYLNPFCDRICLLCCSAGLGACGITNKDTDFIAAVSHLLFDVFPYVSPPRR